MVYFYVSIFVVLFVSFLALFISVYKNEKDSGVNDSVKKDYKRRDTYDDFD